MAFNDRVIDQVQQANDIVEIVSAYAPLKRAGRNFKANCPFHHEKTPSFIVSAEKQIFHCFGCGAGGDVFSFLMKYEQLTFPEALRQLAERARIPLPEEHKRSPQEHSQKERLYEMYQIACDFYHAQILDPETGRTGRSYLEKRSFGLNEIKTFRLGFSGPDGRSLGRLLLKKGFRSEELFASGLVTRSQSGSPYDLFRGRVMFPIMNAQGRVIGFGGRVLEDDGRGTACRAPTPKYLNSPETALFRKRRELYALHLSKRAIAESGENIRQVFITEGYLDCIRMYANGFENVVATLGTSLTEEHVRMLKRYADEAILFFDGDKAGEQASLRALDIFVEEGMAVKALCLPSGFDPDDFIRVKGKEAMRLLIQESQDLFDFKLRILFQRYNKSDSLGLLKIAGDFIETFAKMKNSILVDRYLQRLAAALGVEEHSLRVELNKFRAKRGSVLEGKARRNEPANRPQKEIRPVEKILLSVMLHFPAYVSEFQCEFQDFEFADEKYGRLYAVLQDIARADEIHHLSSSQILNRIQDPDVKNLAIGLMAAEWRSETHREQIFRDCLQALKKEKKDRELRLLRLRIQQAENAGEEELALKYMKAYQELLLKT